MLSDSALKKRFPSCACVVLYRGANRYARLLAVMSTSLKVPPVQLELWLKPVFDCFDRKDNDACPQRELVRAYSGALRVDCA